MNAIDATEEELRQWLQTVLPDATQVIARAEVLEVCSSLGTLGQTTETIATWLRQEVASAWQILQSIFLPRQQLI